MIDSNAPLQPVSDAPARSTAATWLGLAGWLALTFAAAFIGSRFGPGDWYAGIEKPSWNPPNWIFGPVWTTLYVLMAIAAWLVWRRWGFAGARTALVAYVVQLTLNAAWSWLFFGRQSPGAALADIVVLLIAIVVTLVLFWRKHRLAGALLIPYLAWVSFATALNLAIHRLN